MMSNGKSYMPKILTFVQDKKFKHEDMEQAIASYTINGWKIISMTHMQGMQGLYTVLLQYEFSEEEMQGEKEKRA